MPSCSFVFQFRLIFHKSKKFYFILSGTIFSLMWVHPLHFFSAVCCVVHNEQKCGKICNLALGLKSTFFEDYKILKNFAFFTFSAFCVMFCWLSFKITTQKKIVSGPNELLSRKVFTALVPEFEVCGKKSMDLFFLQNATL